jgi:hypothetical protein
MEKAFHTLLKALRAIIIRDKSARDRSVGWGLLWVIRMKTFLCDRVSLECGDRGILIVT